MTPADRQRENRRKSEIAIARTLNALKRPPAEVLRANKYLSAETADSRLKPK